MGNIQQIVRMPLDRITPDPGQARRHFDRDKLDELKESIRANGLINPLRIMPAPTHEQDGTYRLVAGERRWRCCTELAADGDARFGDVDVIIMPADTDAFVVGLVDNLQRETLDPIEEARGYARLKDERGLTQAEIARRVGKSQPHISLRLLLLKLPDDYQEAIAAGQLTAAHGELLARHCKTHGEMREVIRELSRRRRGISHISVTMLGQHLKRREQLARLLDRKVPAHVWFARELRDAVVPAGMKFLALLEQLVGREGEESKQDAFAKVWVEIPQRDRTQLLRLLRAINSGTNALVAKLQQRARVAQVGGR